MAPVGRKRDQIDLFDNVTRRVRNLETGVHPVGSDLQYYDTIDPTLIDFDNAKIETSPSGTTDTRPRWLRRVGITQLIGEFRMHSGYTTDDLDPEETLATLPPQARPLVDLLFRGGLSVAPFFYHYRVQADGDLVLLAPSSPTDTTPDFFSLSGSSYPVN